MNEVVRLVRVEIGKLSLKQGDILVLYAPSNSNQAAINRLKSTVAPHMPPGTKLMIVPSEFKFDVIHGETADGKTRIQSDIHATRAPDGSTVDVR